MSENKTNFGFKEVNINQKSNLVKEVFSNVAKKYDLMNDFMSAGIHRIWKNEMIKEINFQNKSSEYKIIDVAGGTGDISFRIVDLARKSCIKSSIKVVDVNKEMLAYGTKRAIDNNYFKDLDFIEGDGENLSFENDSFDFFTIAFGIRNFTDINKGLKEAYRVLKPNGKFICLEFSHVNNKLLEKIYDIYSFKVIPKIGEIVLNDRESYQYLVESIRKFPNQELFKNMIEDVGFKQVSYKNLTQGAAAIHVGYKI